MNGMDYSQIAKNIFQVKIIVDEKTNGELKGKLRENLRMPLFVIMFCLESIICPKLWWRQQIIWDILLWVPFPQRNNLQRNRIQMNG